MIGSRAEQRRIQFLSKQLVEHGKVLASEGGVTYLIGSRAEHRRIQFPSKQLRENGKVLASEGGVQLN